MSAPTSRGRRIERPLAVAAVACAIAVMPAPSDHADPIDPFDTERLEGGLTDLFAFPVGRDGRVVLPFERDDGIPLARARDRRSVVSFPPVLTDAEQTTIHGISIIVCARRQLTDETELPLAGYTYSIHLDVDSQVAFAGAGDAPPTATAGERRRVAESDGIGAHEARARYGGSIVSPATIEPDLTVELRLDDDATLADLGLRGAWTQPFADPSTASRGSHDPDRISVWAGLRDDPFIFPGFFGTNVVGIAVTIPMAAFPGKPQDWLLWATSHDGGRQVDHVGRALRTQNPRFELLNTLPPKEHVAALCEEDRNPSLMRDLALKFDLQSLFGFRSWDFVPDVMIYSRRFRVGFPNGRLPTDDIAAIAAQTGDTLLLELSYHQGRWAREQSNDKPFRSTFPYLAEPWSVAEPWPDRLTATPHSLHAASWIKLIAIALGVLALIALETWLFARWYHRRRLRRRYL